MECVLKTTGLTKAYPSCVALSEVSLQLEAGHIYGLVGNNGAGKSTLMQMIAGLLRPTSGTISLFGGTSERENRAARRKTGFLFSDAGLSEGMTALQNLLALQRLKGYRDPAEARRLLSQMRLDGSKAEKERVHTFSTGQRQSTAFAAALLGQPGFLVLDEPLIGLDVEAIGIVRSVLAEECRNRGTTILLSSHNLPELYRLATDYLFLSKGRLLQSIDHESLCKRRTYAVTLTVSSAESALRILQAALPQQSIQMQGNRIILNDCTIPAAKLQSLLTQQGISVEDAASSGSSLEDYFLSVIGDEK